ncbi:unnamed protein product [Ranitomeya imitator]|uniref:Lamina-associated polypeptide 2 alpha C-terminal domain-containing protein n=1 Tax=Ranitomeya imitator TaxID=111125 RepID=A0ABN9LB33_9NEOB|nr:unnamed protein product [Ranitomeya imitator]
MTANQNAVATPPIGAEKAMQMHAYVSVSESSTRSLVNSIRLVGGPTPGTLTNQLFAGSLAAGSTNHFPVFQKLIIKQSVSGLTHICVKKKIALMFIQKKQIFENLRQEYTRYHRRRQLEVTFNQTEVGQPSEVQTSSALTAPSSPGSISKKDQPSFSLRQVGILCERLLKDHEDKIKEEYEKILHTKLEAKGMKKQYESFVKFTHDKIMRRFGARPASWMKSHPRCTVPAAVTGGNTDNLAGQLGSDLRPFPVAAPVSSDSGLLRHHSAPAGKGDKEPTSGSKTKTTRKCAVCMKKLSSSYKKSLCKECTDKIISEERPSLIEEIKTLIQQEIKTSLATLSQPTPSPSAPPEAKKRKLNPQEEEQEDSQGETSDEPPEEGELSLDSETVQQERYYFSSSDIEELLTAVRKTMEVEEEKTAQSVQEEMFGGLRSRKRQVFPIHQNIRDLVLDEWESPEKKLTTPAEIKDRFPVDAETASCWSEVPKVDVQIARVAKKTTLPFEDASQLRDPLERKMDGLLRKSWETSASLLNINSVSTCVARSMHRWLGQLEEHLSSGTPREDILASLPIFQKATGFFSRCFCRIRESDGEIIRTVKLGKACTLAKILVWGYDFQDEAVFYSL